MKQFKKLIKKMLLLGVALLLTTPALALPNEPLAMLLKAQGKVEYSSDSKNWKEVSRNKFLFQNERVRTGDDGTCKLIDQKTNAVISLNPNSEIEISADGLRAYSGKISQEDSAVNLMGILQRKFAKVQKYAVVLRSASKRGHKFNIANEIVLSEDYPELVWESLGPEYEYKLIVDEKVFDVPATKKKIVRFKLPAIKIGEFSYTVQVVKNGKVLYSPQKRGNIRWMPEAEQKALKEGEECIHQIDPCNRFLLANYLDEMGLKVAAMDEYQRFFEENPDQNDMRPFLIKVYNDLKLKALKSEEIMRYNQMAD
jgi:hypothetical protein